MVDQSDIQRFLKEVRGSVSLVGTLMMPVLLGFSGLALEYGSVLLARVESQRVADLSASAGAIAYAGNQDVSEMAMAGKGIAQLNGVANDNVTITLEPNPSEPGAVAVRATIAARQVLLLSRVMNSESYLDLTVDALASTVEEQPVCILALDGSGGGVTLSGGAAVTAKDCIVASNASVSTPCGTFITTETVKYNSGNAPGQCNNVLTPGGGKADVVKTQTPDPLAEHPAVAVAAARIALVAARSAPTVPTGTDIFFGWDQAATRAQATAAGCSATFASSTWTFTCAGKPNVSLGNITMGGGLTLDFGKDAPATTVYTFSGRIENGGALMRFAPGNYTIAKGIIVPGGARTEFGAGSFHIGPASGGNAITVGGGATLVLGSPLATSGTFEIHGDVVTEGGSCLLFGPAPYHDIAGSIKAAGGLVLGAGVHALDGYLHLGANGGGSVSCNGVSVSVEAIDATIIVSGKGVPTSGNGCANLAFCATAGYSNMKIEAPTSGVFAKLAVIGPTNPAIHSGASFQSGASGGKISGAFYFPNGPFSMSGGASASGGATGCLQLIGSRVTLSGGATAASECFSPIGGTKSSVRLLE